MSELIEIINKLNTIENKIKSFEEQLNNTRNPRPLPLMSLNTRPSEPQAQSSTFAARAIPADYAAAVSGRPREWSYRPGQSMVFHRRHNGHQRSGAPGTWQERDFPKLNQYSGSVHDSQYRGGRQNRTVPINADNTKVSDLGRKIYNYIQLKRAAAVWTDFPSSLNRNFSDLFHRIRPPINDKEFQDAMQRINSSTKSEILIAVQQHLDKMTEEVKSSLKNHNPQDKGRAAALAKHYTRENFGNKISPSVAYKWVGEALSITGLEFPATTAVAPSNTKITPAAEACLPDQPSTSNLSTAARKRKNTSSPEPPSFAAPNRFEVLTSLEETEEQKTPKRLKKKSNKPSLIKNALTFTRASDRSNLNPPQETDLMETQIELEANETLPLGAVAQNPSVADQNLNPAQTVLPLRPVSVVIQPCPNPTKQIPSVAQDSFNNEVCSINSQQPQKSPDSDLPLPASQPAELEPLNIVIHDKNKKDAWVLKPRAKDLLIADSNMKLSNGLLPWMDVQVYPGLRLDKLHDLLAETAKTRLFKEVRSITISAGINHKSENFKTKVAPLMSRLHALLKSLNIKHCFVGISMPPQIPSHEKDVIRNLNSWAANNFKQQYVNPLKDNEVSVSLSDAYKIHYDFTTVKRIASLIRNFHFLFLQTPLPRPNPNRRTSN